MHEAQGKRLVLLARVGTVVAILGLIVAGAFWLMQSSPVLAGVLSMDSAVAFQTSDKLLVAVTIENPHAAPLTGTLQVSLLDPTGQVLATQQLAVRQKEPAESQRFEFARPQQAPSELQLRVEFGKEQVQVPLSKVLLVKAHETAVLASKEWHPGSQAAIRLQVQGAKSLHETVPLGGAEFSVCLVENEGKKIRLQQGRTDAKGSAVVTVPVPNLPPGQYKVEIHTRSPLGEEKLEQTVQLKAEPKILLVSDKPLYQPGQIIHLRALALRPFDLTPVADSEILFEIQDPKGNKVFKRSVKTSQYGIASVDFQLADEVNMGDYQIRAAIGQHEAKKTVAVKKYVLPKFKAELITDKKFYLPKETAKAELQCDYFFGKPVANATVKVSASTFDVQFKEFARWEGKTDANGHAKFEIQLPDYFVGQPLQKGDALVKFEVTVTDTAEHSETITRTYPVSDQPIRVGLIPEGGRLVPEMENRIFVAAVYPDGSPAGDCTVRVWPGQAGGEAGKPEGQKLGEPIAVLRTNAAGLAELTFAPRKENLRQAFAGGVFGGDIGPGIRPIRPGRPGIVGAQPAQIEPQTIELLGGQTIQLPGPRLVCDLLAEAQDKQGHKARASATLSCELLGENVLLRLDKAVYRAGDTMVVDIRSSAGLPTVYLDIIKSGQVLLSQWLDVKDGKASAKLDIPPALFGSLEVHAYQMLADGEIIRDSRVIYVQPSDELKIEVSKQKEVFRPGEATSIRFQVTDAAGKPTPAALGVIIVDEAVYALQEMQPGLEKVFFTLQEELLKPKVQIVQPGVPFDQIVRQPIDVLPAEKQQIAQVLLAPVRPKPPQRWEVNPAVERQQRAQEQVQTLGQVLWAYVHSHPDCIQVDPRTGATQFKKGILRQAVQQFFGEVNKEILQKLLTTPFGEPVTEDNLAELHPGLKAERLATAFTSQKMLQLYWAVLHWSEQRKAQLFQNGQWTFPADFLQEAVSVQQFGLGPNRRPRPLSAQEKQVLRRFLQDAWGRPIHLVAVDKKQAEAQASQFAFHVLISAGPDGKFGTEDDLRLCSPTVGELAHLWWLDAGERKAMLATHRGNELLNRLMVRKNRKADFDALADGGAIHRELRAVAPAAAARPGAEGAAPAKGVQEAQRAAGPGGGGGEAGEPLSIYVREYFPETLLWQPQLITDDHGVAHLPLQLADSITTWRLTASASSKGGLLGGTTAPLRVFQDFFVDLDLPRTLTQNDEIAFPVAIYNYLKEPQTVLLSLQPEDWFELTDGQGYERKVNLKPNEVTSVKFRIRAKKIGDLPLTVTARGTQMSDAIKRSIEVLPDGEKIEKAITDRLTGRAVHQVEIPDGIVPDSAKILVKIYPGVMSQVIEGVEGMLRMPFGCFEQTSSVAYPNILVADYVKKARVANPQILAKAEQYLNIGYQKLLTFERPGGGFDWWGNGEPLVWLSAYGLMEFTDMAKVYPIDTGVITRTQQFLLRKQEPDGTWSRIGATHGETIERMGNPKLLLTSYVTWALLESGYRGKEVDKAIAYIREHRNEAGDNAYVLALVANALASYDPKHQITLDVLQTLDKLRKTLPEWNAICFPVERGVGLTYARGDSLAVETTALAVLAMLKAGQFHNSINQGLTYLVKSKGPGGTWGSTQATILALKAIVASYSGIAQREKATFTVTVNGEKLFTGEVNQTNADVLQLFEVPKDKLRTGLNEVRIDVTGETGMMYQIVSRYYRPWTQRPEAKKPVIDVSVEYDRTELRTADTLKAKATLRYHGEVPTYMVIVDLGIPPGFTLDAGDFAEMVSQKKIERFTITPRVVTLYLGDVKPGDIKTFEYTLKPKYPIRAKTPSTVAYEYYTPANRAEAKPVEITVRE